jgi:hypothetical protein
MQLEDIQRLNEIEEQQSKQRTAVSGQLLVQSNLVMDGLAQIKRIGIKLKDMELTNAVRKLEKVSYELRDVIHNKFLTDK